MNRKIGGILVSMIIIVIIFPIHAPMKTIAGSIITNIESHQPPTFDIDWIQDNYNEDKNILDREDFGFWGINYTGWTPPDPIIASGPEHLVAMTNGAIAFFQKDGTKDYQDEIEDVFGFWGEQGATGFVFDPEVIYDPYADRFMAMACERAPGSLSYFLLAISDDMDPNGMWHKYRFDVTSLAGGDIDSPNIAVDSEAIYLTADFFTGGDATHTGLSH